MKTTSLTLNYIYEKINQHRKNTLKKYELEVYPGNDKIFKCFEYFDIFSKQHLVDHADRLTV